MLSWRTIPPLTFQICMFSYLWRWLQAAIHNSSRPTPQKASRAWDLYAKNRITFHLKNGRLQIKHDANHMTSLFNSHKNFTPNFDVRLIWFRRVVQIQEKSQDINFVPICVCTKDPPKQARGQTHTDNKHTAPACKTTPRFSTFCVLTGACVPTPERVPMLKFLHETNTLGVQSLFLK